MKKNIELNHLTNVVPVNKTVSDKCTTAPFYFRGEIGTGGSLFQTNRTNESSVTIECITIDGFLGGETVDVVKMDIEGFEPYALEGMKETLDKTKNILLFLELAPNHLSRAGVSPDDFLAQLDKAGFACQVINEERRCLQPTTTELIPEEGFSRGYCNLYCVKKANSK